jgi:hypothetical protein
MAILASARRELVLLCGVAADHGVRLEGLKEGTSRLAGLVGALRALYD